VNARQTLDALADFLDEELTLEAAVVARPAKKNDPVEIRAIGLGGAADEYFRAIIETAVARKLRPPAFNVRKLDPVYKEDPEDLEWERLADVDAVRDTVARLNNLSPYAPFDDGDDGFKRRLSYWAAILTDQSGEQAYFFRSFGASAELSRKRGKAFVSRNGEFVAVEQRIFLIDDLVDCFVYDDFVYVIRKRDYRRIFDQLGKLLRRARTAAADLHAKVPIANFDAFADACGSDSRLADKILAVHARDYFEDLSYPMLEPVIAEFSLNIPTQQVDGEIQLIFRTEPDQRFRILKLVDDDYLASTMTHLKYEVNSKTKPPI
jgi:hypothetical protein